MSQERLWIDPSGRWEIALYLRETMAGRIIVIDNERGVNDWPIDYGYSTHATARIAYDHPEWWPSYVKAAVEIIMTQKDKLEDRDLVEIRFQLVYAIAFMAQTDDGIHEDGEWWWAREMPAYPCEYVPEEWNETNWCMEKIWDNFFSDLLRAGLHERYEQARQLPIADLLAVGNPYTLE